MQRVTYFGKEFDLLVMGRLFSFPTADNGFYKDKSDTKLTRAKENKDKKSHSIKETEQLFVMKRPFDFIRYLIFYKVLYNCEGWLFLLGFHYSFLYSTDEKAASERLSHMLTGIKQNDGKLRGG